eukprot:210300_1
MGNKIAMLTDQEFKSDDTAKVGDCSDAYTYEATLEIVTELQKKHNVTIMDKYAKEAMEKAMEYLQEMDNIERGNVINEFLKECQQKTANKKQIKANTFCSNLRWICNYKWRDWRQRTHRNYPKKPSVVPVIPIATFVRRMARSPQENMPEMVIQKDDSQSTVKYTFTNQQNIQKRMTIVNHNKNYIHKSLQKDLSNGIQSYQNTKLNDYRYPIKERLANALNNNFGYRFRNSEWYCDLCWRLNAPNQQICANALCANKRKTKEDITESYLQQFDPKIYDYHKLNLYDTQQYKKWKIRIE